VSEADKIMDDADYIWHIFDHIELRWPTLYVYIINDKSRPKGSRSIRTFLKKTIGYDGVNTFDGIIKHIQKNEHMLAWWIL